MARMAHDDRKQIRPGWYVVQVTPNTENRMCEVVKHACAALDARTSNDDEKVGLKDCFNPRFASRKKRMGTWYDTNRPLLPGYVVADVANPAALSRALRNAREFTRVLAGDKTYSPLDNAERQWIEMQSKEEDRTIPLSFGERIGGKVVVTSGPLKGNEAMITKIDRKNCMAYVEFHAGQFTFKTAVGLVVMPTGEVQAVS